MNISVSGSRQTRDSEARRLPRKQAHRRIDKTDSALPCGDASVVDRRKEGGDDRRGRRSSIYRQPDVVYCHRVAHTTSCVGQDRRWSENGRGRRTRSRRDLGTHDRTRCRWQRSRGAGSWSGSPLQRTAGSLEMRRRSRSHLPRTAWMARSPRSLCVSG